MGLPATELSDKHFGPWLGWEAEGSEFQGLSKPQVGRSTWLESMAEGTLITVTDEELMKRIAEGDAEAFAAFYDRYETLLYSIALKILHTESEAEDVVQDAAVLIWERAPLYQASQGRPASWAVAVLRNKAIDRLRSSRRRGDLMERATEEFAVMESTQESEGTGWSGDSAGLVRKGLVELPVEQRQAIELAFFGGLSQSEIAERLREPLGTIKARIRRGMLAMRDALEGAL